MICPGCKAENIPGADVCESCGQDLHQLDLPSAAGEFTNHLLNDRLGDVAGKETPVLAPSDPVALREEDTLATALHKMSIGGFRHIPLVKDGRPTRVISIRDLFRHVSTFIYKQP